MVLYNFKRIQPVPTGKDFIDIVLTRTQRKTPTVVHKGYAISRIRSFYMRKVKYTGQTYHDKLSIILTEFPLLDDIHPFYADLINVLYDRDHYKLALGQLTTARHLIDNLGKDYARLLKYGDSLYRCKQLKRAALGRMCTIMKKQTASLAYLEQVRQHLSRLPSIDPNTRTLLLCGFPNVGKSSFVNKLTRANVEVQPYAFTTKSLFVGHMDYKFLRWQVIDTPGILDHPLEERNTIEMQAVTALAHLRAAVLFVLDISEQCGFTIKEQVSLFSSLKPLFSGKPLVLALNKIDVLRPEAISEADRLLIQQATNEASGVHVLPMSTMSEEGVMDVKNKACDLLLEQRVQVKLAGKRLPDVLNRIHVATPVPRDNKERPATIPESVREAMAQEDYEGQQSDLAQKMIDWDGHGHAPGFRTLDWKKQYLLKDDEWRFDIIPELIDGKNISDFIDADILARLDELEQEEEQRLTALADDEGALRSDEDEPLDEEEERLIGKLREKKKLMVMSSRLEGHQPNRSTARKPQSISNLEAHLNEMGIDGTKAVERVRSLSRGRKRSRSESAMDTSDAEKLVAKKAHRVHSTSRSRSHTPGDGFASQTTKTAAVKLFKKQQFGQNKAGRASESDRHIHESKPRHLFAGKRKAGKTDRR